MELCLESCIESVKLIIFCVLQVRDFYVNWEKLVKIQNQGRQLNI